MIQKEVETKLLELQQLISNLDAETKTKKRGVEKQPALGFVAKLLLPMCFTALEGVAGQIKDPTAQKYALFAINTLSDLVAILTDNEKTDKMAAIGAWFQDTAPEKEKALIDLVKLIVTNTRGEGTAKKMFLNMLERIEKLIK